MSTQNTMENDMSGSGQAKKHTNLSYLKDLSRGDNNFILEMISVFLTQTPEAINSLKTHLNNKDWKGVRGVAHKMKPSMTFMGMNELESVIASIEDYAAKETSLELIPGLVQTLENVCNEALKELEAEKKILSETV